jgi:hypothetical protein
MNRKIMPITVKPTQADLAIAREVVRYTNERTEKAAPGARTNICSRPLRLAGGCGAAGVQQPSAGHDPCGFSVAAFEIAR